MSRFKDSHPGDAANLFDSINLYVLHGVGDGTFDPISPTELSTGAQATFVATGDFRRDGRTDIAISDVVSNSGTCRGRRH